MALETVVFQRDLFGHSSSTSKELFNLFQGGNWSFEEEEEEFGALKIGEDDAAGSIFYINDDLLENPTPEFLRPGENNVVHQHSWESSLSSPVPYNSLLVPHFDEFFNQANPTQEANLSPDIGAVLPTSLASDHLPQLELTPSVVDSSARPKRRRPRSRKNKEEIENQRMTHIAVERNRRKQMNDYLSVLRSLMPQSYVQRGDQASIIGGAINFVKELEQRLQLISAAQKEIQGNSDGGDHVSSPPFSEFFTFPQYSTMSAPLVGETQSSVADIEVTMVESHASLKIRSKRRPKQLLKIVSGLQFLRLTILHLNVTTKDLVVLYSLSVKVEDDCKLTSVDEIATAVHQMLGGIQEEAASI